MYDILGMLIIVVVDIYVLGKIQDLKFNFKDYRNYIYVILFGVLMVLRYYYVPSVLQIIVTLLLYTLVSKLVYKSRYLNSFTSSIVLQFIAIVSEIVLMIFITLLNKGIPSYDLLSLFSNKLLANSLGSLAIILISKIKLFKKFYNFINKIFGGLGKYKSILYSLVLFSSVSILFLMRFKHILDSDIQLLIFNIVIFVIYFTIITISMVIDYKYNKMKSKYDLTKTSLTDYESILNKYRVTNHENKNQLIMIRNMIKNNDTNVDKYIDKIVKDKVKDDEKLMFQASKIPTGGLRAVVYSKLLKMKEKSIPYNLEIAREIQTMDLSKIDNNTIIDMCNIISIFLDNAIDESVNNKEKEISIEMYYNKYLYINISNVIERNIDINLINKEGYTTKEQGHGYGLPFAKKIINDNNDIEHTTSIEDDLLIQGLKIRID